MSPLDFALLALIAGSCGGAVAGAIVARLYDPRQPDNDLLDSDLDADLEDQIAGAASSYASRIGHPEAADLIANKLRLGGQLQRRRQTRRRSVR